MPTAREIMTTEAEWVEADATAIDVAKRFTSSDLGALPICDGQGHLQGMVTDRDLVVKVLARDATRRRSRLASSPIRAKS